MVRCVLLWLISPIPACKALPHVEHKWSAGLVGRVDYEFAQLTLLLCRYNPALLVGGSTFVDTSSPGGAVLCQDFPGVGINAKALQRDLQRRFGAIYRQPETLFHFRLENSFKTFMFEDTSTYVTYFRFLFLLVIPVYVEMVVFKQL
ncbi:hypothetical protein NDU88_009475 [Pleurodeles waltl]|uniref:Uncharacterized protein n=1 Tax=Pleurodeles waltl TaxID=8319 RepID=A0AAV7RXQ6_PLEWA|nr:hypothetical protein NDU88_009475 [Pleurodeles waltl]